MKLGDSVNIRLSADQKAFIEYICNREDIPASEFIRDAINQYEENRARNQRMELFANMTNVLHKEGETLSEETAKEFASAYVDEFETARQVDQFLDMPPQVIEASIRDALQKFEPTFGDAEAWFRERGEYEFEKKTKKEKPVNVVDE